MFEHDFIRFGSIPGVSLEEIETIRLMNRVDTKYVFSIGKVQELLTALRDEYLVVGIASQRYRQMLHAHAASRYPRFKVRERTYSQNEKRLSLNQTAGTEGLANQIIIDNTPFRRE